MALKMLAIGFGGALFYCVKAVILFNMYFPCFGEAFHING